MAPPVCEEGLAAPQQHLTETPLCKQAAFSFLSTVSPLFGVGGQKGGEDFFSITFSVLINSNV